MDGGSFTLRWDDDPRTIGNSSNVVSEEVICGIDSGQSQHFSNMANETINSDADHAIAAENLMFLAHDIVGHMSYVEAVASAEEVHQPVDDDEIECLVTEEVITDDWVEPGGQERIEVPLEHLSTSAIELNNEENDIDVPLPTDQDEYTAMRPWPCDFCSRRFRKKAALMNHMVAHQNARPYTCNLCGVGYVRRADLMNHLKVHAYVPEDTDDVPNDYEDYLDLQEHKPVIIQRKRKGGRGRRKQHVMEQNGRNSFSYLEDEPQGSARTQQYSRSVLSSNALTPLPPSDPTPIFLPTDPRKPFVCQHCGVGFAREKALASHSRIHGGDSPLECRACGELCWSREALAQHTRQRHPHLPPTISSPNNEDSNFSGLESDYSLEDSNLGDRGMGKSRTGGVPRGPELFCQDCGAAFQRADLLRRHAVAAHSSYKREVVDTSPSEETNAWEDMQMHHCSVCGEEFGNALDLLAHAEGHARTNMYRCWRCGSVDPSHSCSMEDDIIDGREDDLSDGPTNRVTVNSSSALDCTYCGKAFRSRARLKRHIALHRSRGATSTSCATCGQRFIDSRALAAHRLSHHPQHHSVSTNNKQFPCRECGKTFGSRSSQQIHIRIHTGERPYGCRFCWKAFADGGTLRKHERIHTGEKPYACAVCPRAFNQRVVLREHVRSHHGGGSGSGGGDAISHRGLACCVCGRHLSTSADLVQHLIQHCDANTALNRQPQVGPRKYKRRRKLKSHDLEASNASLAVSGGGDSHSDDGSRAVEVSMASKRARRNRISLPAVDHHALAVENDIQDDVYGDYVEQNDKTIEDILPEITVPSKTRTKRKRGGASGDAGISNRAKMIHTQRTRAVVASESGRRRGSRQQTQISRSALAQQPQLAKLDEAESRVRPRTKNVRYHEPPIRHPQPYPQAMFPAPPDLADDLRAILLPPIKAEPSSESDNEAKTLAANAFNVKPEPDAAVYRCEMCSESFEVREELLLHVPIHI